MVPVGTSAFNKVDALRRTELFRNLSYELLEKIAALTTARHLSRGQVLVSEHEEAPGIYVIVQGEFRSVRQTHDGREQVLSTERAGSVIGVVPVFNGGNFYSTLIADAGSEVIFLATRDLHSLCREHTEVLWNLATALACRVRHLAELVETLALRNVEQRLAQYLLTVGRERGVRAGGECVFELTLTRAQVASRIGSVREVVSRAFSQLLKKGLIQMQGRRLITIPEMKLLGQFVGAEAESEGGMLASEVPSDMA
ncbi:MAG TPA: Crp/Fnr family transcriptional regulator [Bryobacteraceae bacterium]